VTWITDRYPASTIHCIDDEIFEWLERRERRRRNHHVRFRGAGKHMLALSFSEFDRKATFITTVGIRVS
jgi:hypothetical protein